MLPIEHHPSTARELWPLGGGDGSRYLGALGAGRSPILAAPERAGSTGATSVPRDDRMHGVAALCNAAPR